MKLFSRLILVAVFVFGGWFFLSRLGQIQETITVMGTINPLALVPALLLTIGFIEAQSRILQQSLKLTGTPVRFQPAARLWLASFFVNVVIPSGFFSGLSYITIRGPKNESGRTNLIIGVMVNLFTSYMAFLLILFLSTILHIVDPIGNQTVFIASEILSALVVVLIILSLVVAEQTTLIIKVVHWFRRIINNFTPVRFKKGVIAEPIEQASEILRRLHDKWYLFLEPLTDGLFVHLMGIGILWTIFLGLGFPIQPTVLASGYVVGALLTIVSITPAGLGVVEVAMPLVFSGLGVPLPIATAATLLYRAFNYWFVLLLGGLAFRRLEKSNQEQAPLEASPESSEQSKNS